MPGLGRGWRFGLDCALAAGGLGVAVWRLVPTLTTVTGLGARAAGTHWGWLGLGVVLGSASLALYGVLHGLLLAVGNARLPAGTVQAVTFVQNAFTQTLPSAGSVASLAYASAAFRRRGVDTTVAVWSVLLAGAISSVTLLVAAPLMLASDRLLSVSAAVVLSGSLALFVCAIWKLLRRPQALVRVVRGAAALIRFVPLARRADWVARPEAAAAKLGNRVTRLVPRVGQWAGLLSVALAGLTTDYAALACCVAATAGFVPWPSVAAGYLAVQGSIALQLTPGGTGPAEAGLLAALMTGGVPAAGAALAVVAYRAIAWLGLAIVGWLIFVYLAEHPPGPAAEQAR